MLDTSAINRLAERPEDLMLVTLAKERLGYMYFLNHMQDREIAGIKSDGSFYDMGPKMQSKFRLMRDIIETLPIITIPHMATLMHNAWILDGSCHVLEEGDAGKAFDKVLNNKIDNLEDAVIIESAIRFHCITVSNDRDMCKNTNAVFPGKAIWYKKFIEQIKASLNDCKP